MSISVNPFQGFYTDSFYLDLKNHLYSYRIRKTKVRQALLAAYSGGLILEIGSGVSLMTYPDESVIYGDVALGAMHYLKDVGIAQKAVGMSITDLPLKDETVTAVICSEVLEHIKDDRRALKELRRVLQPGGIIILTVPANPKYYTFDDKYVGHERRYAVKAIPDLMKSTGFCEISLSKVTGLLDKFAMLVMSKIYAWVHSKKGSEQGARISGSRHFFPIYKILNKIYGLIVLLEAFIIPLQAAAVVRICAKKAVKA